MRKILNIILNLLFPIYCEKCGEPEVVLCNNCEYILQNINYEKDGKIFSIFSYKDKEIRKLIWKLKYREKTVVANRFGGILYDKMLEEISDLETFANFSKPILIPIPLSRKKFRKRGYNQSALITKNIVGNDEQNLFEFKNNILIKDKETKSQMSIKDKVERLKNLAGSYAVKNKGEIKDRNIILIDDVFTTGATLKEAREILLKAGAKEVIAWTVAH